MKYLPIRVHSVFSRGLGTVSASENAAYSASLNLPAMAICDPHSVLGWESFFRQAIRHGLKPMLGVEIKLQEIGTLLIFPRNDRGFSSLTHSLNHRISTLTLTFDGYPDIIFPILY